jgi:S1-C subfamily serine protease
MKKPVLVILLILVFVCSLYGQADTSSRYHISVKGKSYGPFTIDDMERMKNNNQINAGTLVWKQGWKQDADSWKAAETVPELAFLFNSQAVNSSGTGFFVSENGVIVTCAHVIEGGSRITVKINNKEYTAQVLTKNSKTDLAVLKINYRNPFHFKVTDFNIVNLGDKVFVLGFPLSDLLGSDVRLTDGIVSAKSGVNSDQTYFQLSAPIQPGNSGGPVFNSNFEIVGVAAGKLNDMAAFHSSGAIPQNINFGIKSGYINPLLDNIRLGSGNVKTVNNAINATVQILCYEKTGQFESSIQIVNKTGYTVYQVQLSPASSDEWGPDRLGSDILQTGQTLTVDSLPLNIIDRYDIHLIDEDGDTYTKWNVLITPNKSIEFTINDLDR